MNTLVTGGAGFIGSHVVEALLRDGHKVVVLDNFSTGKPGNLDAVRKNKCLKVIKADVSNFENIRPYFKNIDWVFHLAALADIVPSINYPLKYFSSNVHGTINVLEASRKHTVKRFIYAASSSCYGVPKAFPTPETAAVSPQYPYALTKYLGEEELLHWGKVYKLAVVSLRLFNVYGLRSRTSGTYGAVFGVFLSQKLANKPLTVVGDGKQTRDFIFVTDVARAFVMAAQSEVKNEIFNVGSGDTYSINKLAQYLDSPVVHMPKRPGEPDCTHANISKIKKLLGWQPEVSFRDGTRVMLDNINLWKDAPVWTPKKISSATKEWFAYLSE